MLAPWKKSYEKPRKCIKKQGHHFADIYVKAMFFPVVMYGWESWTIRTLSSEEWMLSNCGAREDSWESLGQYYLLDKSGFPGGSVVKSLPANARVTGDLGLIPGLGRWSGGRNSSPF